MMVSISFAREYAVNPIPNGLRVLKITTNVM